MESEGLRIFLKSVGDSVYSLNTICVGLEGVSKGEVKKSESLTINWKSSDPNQASVRARNFAIRASLVFVEEALLEYLKYLGNCPDQPSEIIAALSAKGATSKVEKLSAYVPGLEIYWMPMVVLLIRWRNQVVHRSATPLRPLLRATLMDNADKIRAKHAAIEISQTLSNFDSKKVTLKDFTTMISITIRFVRQLDLELSPNIRSSKSLRTHLIARDLLAEYKNIIGINGADKQKKKFDNFIRSNFPSLVGALSDELFRARFEVLQEGFDR